MSNMLEVVAEARDLLRGNLHEDIGSQVVRRSMLDLLGVLEDLNSKNAELEYHIKNLTSNNKALLDTIEKLHNKTIEQLALLQEHGLVDYGN